MKFPFHSNLVEGIIQSRPNRFIMIVTIEGNIHRCHCPATGRIGEIRFNNVPCLLSKASNTDRKTKYTVEAISLDKIGAKKKNWIGINQGRMNDYLDFFIGQGLLERMVGRLSEIKREVTVGKSRIDFLLINSIGNPTYLEAKTIVMAVPNKNRPDIAVKPKKFSSFERLIRHFGALVHEKKKGKRAIILLCFPYDAIPFQPPKPDKGSRKIQHAARAASNSGVESWQLNFKVSKSGVSLLDYFRLDMF
ncbi:MAG: DNA/RNA nuclease SfsA [Candidatus Micrarchaeia archaeon]